MKAFRVGSILLVAALGLGGCATGGGFGSDATSAARRARVHYELGLDHLAKGRPALAIRELELAQRLDPHDPWVPLALGEAFRRKGRLEDAERNLLRALEVRPGFQEARLNLSALYILMGRYADAIAQAKPLVDDPTFPAPWRALTNLGWAEFKLGRRAQAREHLELAVEYHDRYWPALLDLGILEAAEGHRLEALQRFEQALRSKPGRSARAELHYRMAEIYVSLGRRNEAIEHLSAAQQARPMGTWGKKSAEYLKLLR